jgi:hypothetical protein
MAKASPSLSTVETASNPAIAAAAAEIHALIHSKAQSPTKDELAAVIAKVAIPAPEAPDVSALEIRAEWEALRSEILAADAKCRALSEASGGLTDEVAAAEAGRS